VTIIENLGCQLPASLACSNDHSCDVMFSENIHETISNSLVS